MRRSASTPWIIALSMRLYQWLLRLGLGPAGLRGEIGGSEGVLIVVAMMALAAAVTAFALRRGLRARTPALA